MLLAVAVNERFGVHGFFAFRLEAVNGDEVAIGTLNHERGAEAADKRGVADDGGSVDDVGVENDASFAEELVFWLRETLIGDDLTVDFGGGILVGLQERHFFGEFSSESGLGVVLWSRGELADLRQMIGDPAGASGGEGMINLGFIEGEMLEGGLMIDGAGVHFFDELHDRIAKIGVAGENGGLDRGGAAVFWK